ncbi:hypothetical protein FOI67_16495 [Geobacillus sp. LEMMJ02]|nr:hypothetical protein FOI67_16495 [Geobacillus sp. LEMMJ02]
MSPFLFSCQFMSVNLLIYSFIINSSFEYPTFLSRKKSRGTRLYFLRNVKSNVRMWALSFHSTQLFCNLTTVVE